MKLWLVGLALLPLLGAGVRAQSQVPLLAPGANFLTGGAPRGLSPGPALPSVPAARPPVLGRLPNGKGPSLNDLEVPSQIGPQPRGRGVSAARASPPTQPLRLLAPPEASRSLQAAVAGAVSRNVAAQGAEARRALAAAKLRSAEAFFPGAPSLGAAYVSDQLTRRTSAHNARDAELSVSTQIWLPGEGSALERAANAEAVRLEAERTRQMLDVAGEVREALAAVAAAEADQRAAQARLRDARALEADLARRVRGRDVAEAELLVASADRIEAESSLSETTASLASARVSYSTLTGLEPDTAALNEALPPAPEARPPNPRLAETQRAVAVAQANRDLAAIQVRDSPEVALVGRRTRDINGNAYDNALGVQLRIPFATDARNGPRRAAAAVEYNDAVLTLAKLERDLRGGEDRARIELASAEAAHGLAGKRATVFDRQRSLFERSYAAGETPLADLIRARTLAFQAEAARDRADVGARQARGRLNQALGLMP